MLVTGCLLKKKLFSITCCFKIKLQTNNLIRYISSCSLWLILKKISFSKHLIQEIILWPCNIFCIIFILRIMWSTNFYKAMHYKTSLKQPKFPILPFLKVFTFKLIYILLYTLDFSTSSSCDKSALKSRLTFWSSQFYVVGARTCVT